MRTRLAWLRANVWEVAGWLSLALALIACVGNCWTNPVLLERIQHADFLYIHTFFRDVVLEGGALKDWLLPPTPYFFPDMAIYGVLRALSASSDFASVAVMLGLPTALAVMLRLVLVRVGASAVVPAMLGLLALGVVCFVRGGAIYLFPILVLSDHVGQMLVGVGSLLLLLTPTTRRAAIVIAMAWATALSDPFYLPGFYVPCALLVLTSKEGSLLKRLIIVVLLLASSLVGMKLRDAFPIAEQPPNLVTLERAKAAWLTTTNTFGEFWTRLFGAALLLGLIGVLISLWSKDRRRVALAMGLSVAGSLALPILIGVALELPASRHIGSVYVLLTAMVPLVLVPLPGSRVIAGLVAVVTLAVSTVTLWENKGGLANVGTLRSHTVGCVDELTKRHPVSRCAAWYWAAKPVGLQAKGPITALQLQANGAPYHWINTLRHTRETADIDCAVFTPGEAQYFVSLFGRPSDAVSCPNTVVLYYEGEARRVLNQRLAPLLRP